VRTLGNRKQRKESTRRWILGKLIMVTKFNDEDIKRENNKGKLMDNNNVGGGTSSY
jgi:hypothetical protein